MALQKKKTRRLNQSRISNTFFGIAGIAISLGILILFLTYAPLIAEELKYTLRQWFGGNQIPTSAGQTEMTPIDKEFGIVIPKLGANARIIANVDPYDSKAYQFALTKGVAHARGTAVPGAQGDVFLFAHSSENFYEALKYNSIFYLLPKLVKGDRIILYYHSSKLTYLVSGSKLVDPKDVSYLTLNAESPTLTLMTCWPPGTNLQRFLVFAELTK